MRQTTARFQLGLIRHLYLIVKGKPLSRILFHSP